MHSLQHDRFSLFLMPLILVLFLSLSGFPVYACAGKIRPKIGDRLKLPMVRYFLGIPLILNYSESYPRYYNLFSQFSYEAIIDIMQK